MTAAATDLVPPPPGWWWAFRALGLRVPEEHRAWVAHHLRSDAAVRRTALLRLVPFVPFYVAIVVIGTRQAENDVPGLIGLACALVGSVIGTQFHVDRNRRRMLRWQRVDAAGEPVEPERFARLGNLAAGVLFVALIVVVLAGFHHFMVSLD